MSWIDKWLYTGLEALKIGMILLFGLVFSGAMLLKARPGEPTDGFLLALLAFASAWMFWYLADAVTILTSKPQPRLILFVFGWTVLGYVVLLAGLASYFLLDFWWIVVFATIAGSFGFWEIRKITAELEKRSSEGSCDGG